MHPDEPRQVYTGRNPANRGVMCTIILIFCAFGVFIALKENIPLMALVLAGVGFWAFKAARGEA